MNPCKTIARISAVVALCSVGLSHVTVHPALAGPAVFFKMVSTPDRSVAECETRAAQALDRVAGSHRRGVEDLALFGVLPEVTLSIACTAVDESVVATVLAAGNVSFEEAADLRDRLLQALAADQPT